MMLRETSNNIAIAEKVMRLAKVCRIALSLDNIPYIVPVSFGYNNKTIYFHSSCKGKKIDILRKNNNVCFEFDINCKLIKSQDVCKYSMEFNSVVGYGKAYFIQDIKEKKAALNILVNNYMETKEIFDFPANNLSSVLLIKIKIEQITTRAKYAENK